MNKDLRSYLDYLRKNHPEELVHVRKEVDPSWEVSAVVRKFQAQGEYPAIFFENVRGSQMPVLTNLFASRTRLAATFETSVAQTLDEYIKREALPTKPKLVSSGPVKEVIIKGDDLDLKRLPMVTHSEKDTQPAITPGVGIVRDPDTSVGNAGIYALHYIGGRRFTIGLGPESHTAHIFRNAEKKGEILPFALALGHHPAVCHGSQSRCPLEVDEFDIMGGLLGEPLELVKCETVDLEVPAYSEIAIEGNILPNVREQRGFFGEFPWHYGPPRLSPVVEVTAITHRKDAIFHDLHSTYIDHNYCGVLGREANLFRKLKEAFPTLKTVVMPEFGCCRLAGVVQLTKEYDGQGKNAALTALAADPYIKLAIVVDEDVNPYDPTEVFWAVTTRTQPDRDFFFIPESFVCVLIPSGYSIEGRDKHGGLDTKVGIDATKPLGLPFPERADVRRSDWEKIDLMEYL